MVDSPEILTVIGQMPELATLMNSLYSCNYKDFFGAFVAVMEQVRADMYLHVHLRWANVISK